MDKEEADAKALLPQLTLSSSSGAPAATGDADENAAAGLAGLMM